MFYYYSNSRGAVALCFIFKIISRIKCKCGLQEPRAVRCGEFCSNKETDVRRQGGAEETQLAHLLFELLLDVDY